MTDKRFSGGVLPLGLGREMAIHRAGGTPLEETWCLGSSWLWFEVRSHARSNPSSRFSITAAWSLAEHIVETRSTASRDFDEAHRTLRAGTHVCSDFVFSERSAHRLKTRTRPPVLGRGRLHHRARQRRAASLEWTAGQKFKPALEVEGATSPVTLQVGGRRIGADRAAMLRLPPDSNPRESLRGRQPRRRQGEPEEHDIAELPGHAVQLAGEGMATLPLLVPPHVTAPLCA